MGPEVKCFTDGSSFVEMGTGILKGQEYAIVRLDEVIEAKGLPT